MKQGPNNAKLPNIKDLIAAGIDPKTGLPIKMASNDEILKANTLATLTVLDRQQALNRYTWYNLPAGLTGELMERVLYYRGQGMFFYNDALGKFFFLPYALSAPEKSSGIDCYGRYTGVTPVQMGASAAFDNEGKLKEMPFNGLTYTPLYEVNVETPTEDQFMRGCVLLRDYSWGWSETVIPREALQRPILDVMANCIPYLNTALMGSTGVAAIRVNSESELPNVEDASKAVQHAALTGKKWIGVVGSPDFQDLSTNSTGQAQEFLLALQSLDNFRLGLYGIQNGGIFDKNSYKNVTDSAMGAANIALAAKDGLTLRQNFCNIVNSNWPLGIWCEITESAVGGDMNGTGVIGDNGGEANQNASSAQGGNDDGNTND